MQVMLMRLMSKGEYLIIPKGTKSAGADKLGLKKKSSMGLTDPNFAFWEKLLLKFF